MIELGSDVTIFGMLVHAPAVNFGYLEKIFVHPTKRQTFAGKLHLVLCNIRDLVIYR